MKSLVTVRQAQQDQSPPTAQDTTGALQSALRWLVAGSTLAGTLLWLLSPRRQQPRWLGGLLRRIRPDGRYFQWHRRRVVAANKERGGQMRARDYLRVIRIRERTGDTVTDRDLAALLRIMGRPSRYPQIVHTHVIATLLDVPRFSERQREKIYRAVMPLLPGDKFNLDQQFGMRIMRHLGERRAVPLIEPLLDHPREKIRAKARETIAELLGESNTPSLDTAAGPPTPAEPPAV